MRFIWFSGATLFSASSNLYEGNISKADISNIYRYDNKLYTIKTNGKQLKKYMKKKMLSIIILIKMGI